MVATAKKQQKSHTRAHSLIDVQHRREIEAKQKALLMQVQRNRDIHERGPHINIDSIAVPRSTLN